MRKKRCNWIRKSASTALAVILSVQMTLSAAVPAFAAEIGMNDNEINIQEEQEIPGEILGSEVIEAVGEPSALDETSSGMVLDSAWEVDRQNDKLVINDDGSITITTERGEWGNMNNLLRQKVTNQADFVMTVKVTGQVTQDFQGAYLMVSSGGNGANGVAAVRRHHSYLSGNAPKTMGMMSNGGSVSEFYTPEQDPQDSVYLRLKKSGAVFTSYYSNEYSASDEGWTQIASGSNSSITQNNLVGTEEIYIGITANSGGSDRETEITFSELRFDGREIPLGVDRDGLYALKLSCEDTVPVGGTVQLGLRGYTADESQEFTEFDSVSYTSADEDVATVDEQGVVTGVAAGKTVISCSAALNGITRSCSLEIQVGEITAEKTWEVTSPDGKTALKVELMTGGSLQYTALQDGMVTLETSPVGLITSAGDFSKNLVYVSETEPVEINETYPMLSGKKDVYTNHCFEKTVTFKLKNNDGVEFDFISRAYDDGTAFRYAIRTEEEQELSISKETTAFQLPAQADVYYMPHGAGQWTYEGYYQHTTTEELTVGAIPSIPLLYKTQDGIWNLITEADLHGTYTGSMTTVEENGLLRLTFDPMQSKAVETTTPFVSPWRTAITGSPETIVNNTMAENLSPARAEGYDFESWVDPGVSSWSWVTYYGGQEDAETHKKFIDLAADMGWEYYILDEGWQPKTTNGDGTRYTGYRDWFYEVRDYANEKGVKLIAWVDSKDISRKEDREARLNQWSEDGIVGIKTDFFNHEAQSVLQVYDQLYKDCAERKMMVNIHGGNKSTGEIRTYPNVLAREAIAGQEQGGITAEQYTLIPFIRGAIGPADVTEQLYSRDTSKTTMGFQVALSVLVENGIHCMGSKPEDYYGVNAAVSLYKDFPAAWDDTKYINAEPGSYVNLARKSGNQWYVGGASTAARVMEVPLDFLTEGKAYTAIIYKEDGRKNLAMEVQNVDNTQTLNISVENGGGYVVRVIPQDEMEGITKIIPSKKRISLEVRHTQKIDVSLQPEISPFKDVIWSSADETIATVDSNGVVKAVKAGSTTITVKSAYDADVKAEITVTVTPERYTLDTAAWEVINPNDQYIINGTDSVTITTENGGIGGNNLFAMKVPESDEDFTITAKVSGGLNADYQGAFITVFDKNNIGGSYVSAGRRHHTYLFSEYPNRFGMMSGGGSISEFYGRDNDKEKDAYLKLVKEGDTFTGYYSFDGETWTLIEQNEKGKQASSVTNQQLAQSENLYVGFYASAGGSTSALQVTFEEFTYNGKPVAVAEDAFVNAIQRAEEAEKALQQAEADKLAAETALKQAEDDKAALEAALEQAETDKAAAETALKQVEAEKAALEAALEQAGTDKEALEEELKQLETEKAALETALEQAEADKAVAETALKQAEDKVQEAKEALSQAEADKEAAEEALKQAEADKLAAEAAQKRAEADKAAAEAAQKQAETERQEALARAEAAEKAAKEAEQKAIAAEEALKKLQEEKDAVKVGDIYTIGKLNYKVKNTVKKTVVVSGLAKKNSTAVSVPAVVEIKGETYKVTAVAKNAFKGNKKLKKVTLGENITAIRIKAFCQNKNLKKVIIRSTRLKKVGKYAFKGISKKAVISVPEKKVKKCSKLITKSKISDTVRIK